MNARVCQLFQVCQHKFANVSLPCEGRLKAFTRDALVDVLMPLTLNGSYSSVLTANNSEYKQP